jgi:acyl carrier protein
VAANPAEVQSAHQPLITSGIMDSFSLVEVSVFIQEEFGVSVPDPAMTVANFDTIEKAMATIARFSS